jgi:hypothetical protein
VGECRLVGQSRHLQPPRQGCNSAEGDIVVLCAYLGQLARLRDALGGEVAVIIDERDQAALDDHEGDKEVELDDQTGSFEHVKVTKRVCIWSTAW